MLAATNTRFSGSKPSKSRRARDKGRVVGPMEQVRSIFEYIKGRDDKRWQKNERFVARYPDFTPEPAKLISGGLSTNFKEMWDQIKQAGTDQVMYRYFDISPNTTLMDELPPELWEAVTIATAAKGIEDYCQEKYGNHDLNYLMSYQFAVDKDGRPHPHVHIITEGSVFDNGKGERVPFAMYPEHLKRCKDCVDSSFAEQLDQVLGPELWQPIYAQWQERIAAEKVLATQEKATRELQEMAQALAGIDVPPESFAPLSLDEVFAPTITAPEPVKAITIPNLPATSRLDVIPSVIPDNAIKLKKRPPPTVTIVQRDQLVQRIPSSPEPATPMMSDPTDPTIESPIPVQREAPAPKPPLDAGPPPQIQGRKLLRALPPLHIRREMNARYAANLSSENGIISITKAYQEDGLEFVASQRILRVNDDAEAAHYMKALEQYRDEHGWLTLMQVAEKAAVENGFLDKNRQDPRFFTEGPDDPWKTLRWNELHPRHPQAQQPSPAPPRQPIVAPEHEEPDEEGDEIDIDDGWGDIDL